MGFSMEPDKLGKDKDNQLAILESNPYKCLHNAIDQRSIYYLPKENAYYTGEGDTPVSEEDFAEKWEQHLCWDFDQWEEKTDKDGKKAYINKFPPSPQNIEKVQIEMKDKMFKETKTIDPEKIIQATLPRKLISDPVLESQVDGPTGREKIINHLLGITRR